ncbi:MAG: hypothetical protein K6E54_09950 [Bacteroidaceae bacterium]|jgi:hypothetical protein|nr:hypothetical protein [Bacteroidaceae bacterium]
MKKFGFLLGVLAISASGLLTSCFSSSGDLNQPNIPNMDGYKGKVVSTTTTSYIQAISKVDTLAGYATVPKEASTTLLKSGWGGILIILSEPDGISKNVTQLSDPSKLSNHEFDAKTIVASCYPDGINFAGNDIRLTLQSEKTRNLDVHCKLDGSETDTLEVTTEDADIYVNLPHFCNWDFYLKGRVEITGIDTLASDTSHTYVKTGDNILSYKARYGYEVVGKTNPYALSYVKQLLGSDNEITTNFTWYNSTGKAGWIIYHYIQKVIHFRIVSGSQTFRFNAYGSPDMIYREFKTIDHDGGKGNN